MPLSKYLTFGRMMEISATIATLLVLAALSPAKEYFITNKPGTGSGTLSNPFGMGDLQPSGDYTAIGNALKVLQPGDILTFRGGDYSLVTSSQNAVNAFGYIRPARSGTSAAPITIRSQPGETVRLINAGGGQPLLGTRSHLDTPLNYINFEGFILDIGTGCGMRMGGSYDKVSYCELIGQRLDVTDNHDGFRVNSADHGTISHCVIHGVQGSSQNSAGIKIYTSSNMVFEDNYIYGNTAGIFDKDSGFQNTIRRNYLTRNGDQFYGNNQGAQMKDYIYDNVLDGQINLHYLSNGTEVHDNLIRGGALAGAWAGQTWNNKIWNNIVVTGGSSIIGFSDPQSLLVQTGANPHFAYLGYNFYSAAPKYAFGAYSNPTQPQNFTLQQMQGFGLELNSAVASASAMFVDQTSYVLKNEFMTAGRYGDAPGPENVAQILDLTRYGPSARHVPIPGDANDDGYVDGLDFSCLLTGWKEYDLGWRGGDFTLDGRTDGLDFSILLTNWHTGRPPAGNQASVPEPSSVMLILGSLMTIFRNRS